MTESDELIYWLALNQAPTIGAVRFIQFIQHFGSPRAVFAAGHSAWQQIGVKGQLLHYLQAPDWQTAEKSLNWLQHHTNNHLLTLDDPHYPALLREIHDPPPVLYVHGNPELLNTTQLAIVGTRNPSRQGESTTQQFAEYLAQAGLTVTSGLALGIDTAVHQGALKAQGKTIAVMGTGLDRVYPAQNRDLAHHIAAAGVLVSELAPGTPAHEANFPRRNRIISGMSVGTLVIEATLRSGALITARQAAEQGREVFAIPGSIHHPLARGCHALIKDGAKLVETAQDIVEELLTHMPVATTEQLRTKMPNLPATVGKPRPTIASSAEIGNNALDPEHKILLECLCAGPTSIDNLVEQSGLTAEKISSMLLILELKGLVTAQAGGLYARLS